MLQFTMSNNRKVEGCFLRQRRTVEIICTHITCTSFSKANYLPFTEKDAKKSISICNNVMIAM